MSGDGLHETPWPYEALIPPLRRLRPASIRVLLVGAEFSVLEFARRRAFSIVRSVLRRPTKLGAFRVEYFELRLHPEK